jgi:hypothetical protein
MTAAQDIPGNRALPETTDCRADARLAVFDHRRGWQLAILGVAATLVFVIAFQVAGVIELSGSGESAFTIDFYVFWAAAKLALQGLPFDAFDVARLQQAAGNVDPDWMPWAYPPGFMMALMPLGLLPFWAAWFVFDAIGLVAFALAVRRFVAGRPQVLLAVALAPAVMPSLIVGQTTMLWMAGLIAALAALRADRPILAGICIGCLTLKPQLGVLLPVMLVACGAWRAILSAVLTTAVLAAVPTGLFGIGYWPRMLDMMRLHGDMVRANIAGMDLMVSPYSAMVGAGVGEPLALALQWSVTAACALIVFLSWRSRTASPDLRAAILFAVIPLASPYLWFYESAFLVPAALFMWRAGVLVAKPGAAALGLAMWLGLAPPFLAILSTGAGIEVFRFVFVPVNIVALLACLRHAMRKADPISPQTL